MNGFPGLGLRLVRHVTKSVKVSAVTLLPARARVGEI